ncbi:MAG: DUF2330 domain-containing protein [Polyangiaceae bacterium]
MKGIAWIVAALLGCVLACWSAPTRACGVWSGVLVPPRPADEQVLMVWDEQTQIEHFVRQVRFSDAKEPFGFVVPTPTRPRLHEIEKEPWELLTKRCNPSWSGTGSAFGSGIGLGSIGTLGRGAGSGLGAAPAVHVLEERRLGDFKAFVLQATDAKEFSAWLKKNRFKGTPELEAWLHHYVELEFYFVALRYEGSQKQKAKGGVQASDELISKTVHISFKTANPYYPYLEPLTKAGIKPPAERKLQVWFVSDRVMQPVARYWGEGRASGALVRPWSEAYPCDGRIEELSKALAGDLAQDVKKRQRVQVFADLKTSREGYGDVLLVPMEPDACSGDCAKQRESLARLLEADVELRRDAKPTTTDAPAPYLAPASCALQPQGNGRSPLPWFALATVVGIAARRRRGRGVAGLLVASGLLLLGCEKTSAPSVSGSSASTPATSGAQSTPAPTATNSVREPKLELPEAPGEVHAKLVSLLGGRLGGVDIPVQATDARTGIGAVTDALPRGLPSPGALAARCTPGRNSEALVRVEIDHDAAGTPVLVMGPISDAAKQCITQALREVPHEKLEAGKQRFALGFGPNTPEQKKLQRRFSYAFGVNAGPARNVMRMRLTDVVVTGRLPKEVVQRIQRRYYGRIRLCAERSPDKTLRELSLSYVIDAEGNVKNVRTKPDGGSAGSCIRTALSMSKFPKPESGLVSVKGKLSFERPE